MWKYVDDTTIAEIVSKNQSSNIQQHVDYLAEQVSLEKFQLNEDKCKELRITFARSDKDFEQIMVNNKNIDCVTQIKILGVNVSSDLEWNTQVSEVINKSAVRSAHYALFLLTRPTRRLYWTQG
ncbi:hypothetical protein AC249_AIPGENE8922 [Exaiptasia diaphana]|nr:hypothetical protein AC249_AIPGENE8922 [Exaiptasia diaphana]